MNWDKLKIRPSSLGYLMTGLDKPNLTEKQLAVFNELSAKEKRTDAQERQLNELKAKFEAPKTLSDGAMTYVHGLVDSYVYGYTENVTSKYLEKGVICELEAIRFLNEHLFECYDKYPEGTYENEWLTSKGCDIKQGRVVRDIKCSWSKRTHPKVWQDAHTPIYEWQLRGYMMLFDCDVAYLDYVLVDTPEELIGYEDISLHDMSNLSYEQRHTSVKYERCDEKEKLIIEAVKLARLEAARYFEILSCNRVNYEI